MNLHETKQQYQQQCCLRPPVREERRKVRKFSSDQLKFVLGHLNELLNFKARAEGVSLCWNAGDHRKW